jgi:ATP-dependent exoDNAse (exonuclease V) beta subunit
VEVPVIGKDSELKFPHFTVLKASAGSGKTHMLTKRFVQFILSEKIPRNNLRNILAVTFSNNAAREMKEKIIDWLKLLHFCDPEKTEQMLEAVSMTREKLAERAGQKVDEILRDYADFEVRTIDSFMTSIFKANDSGSGKDNDYVKGPRKNAEKESLEPLGEDSKNMPTLKRYDSNG